VTEQGNAANLRRGQRLVEVEPFVFQDSDHVSLQFRVGEIQSRMSKSDPHRLVLPYTRTMTTFTVFQEDPRRIAIIGLGGGSMAKWCYRHLPASQITVVEINAKVIALRDRFSIPADDERFCVLCGDGADYVLRAAHLPEVLLPEVLLVDGFDLHGQPPQLCSQMFYDDCYRALAPEGLFVANLCGAEDRRAIERIRRTFGGHVLVAAPEDDGNTVVFALKGERLWRSDRSVPELVSKLRARLGHAPYRIEV